MIYIDLLCSIYSCWAMKHIAIGWHRGFSASAVHPILTRCVFSSLAMCNCSHCSTDLRWFQVILAGTKAKSASLMGPPGGKADDDDDDSDDSSDEEGGPGPNPMMMLMMLKQMQSSIKQNMAKAPPEMQEQQKMLLQMWLGVEHLLSTFYPRTSWNFPDFGSLGSFLVLRFFIDSSSLSWDLLGQPEQVVPRQQQFEMTLMQKMGMESGGSAPSDMPMFPPPAMDGGCGGCGGCGGFGGCEPKKDAKSSLPAALANKQMLDTMSLVNEPTWTCYILKA